MIIEVSIGEIVDKITILTLKIDKILDEDKSKNIFNELTYLASVCPNDILESDLAEQLFETNEKLWEVEDKLRDCERLKIFDSYFIKLARSVYKLNDKRASVKKKINLLHSSEFVEEKSYAKY